MKVRFLLMGLIVIASTAEADMILARQWKTNSLMTIGEMDIDAQGNIYVAGYNIIETYNLDGSLLASSDLGADFVSDVSVLGDSAFVAIGTGGSFQILRTDVFLQSPTVVPPIQTGEIEVVPGAIYFVLSDNWVTKYDRSNNFIGLFITERTLEDIIVRDGVIWTLGGAEGAIIQKFTTEGGFVSAFGRTGTFPGLIWDPEGFNLDPSGSMLFVADSRNDRITTFDTAGNYLDNFPLEDGPDGFRATPLNVAVTSTHVIVCAREAGSQIIIQVYTYPVASVSVARATWGQVKVKYP